MEQINQILGNNTAVYNSGTTGLDSILLVDAGKYE